MEKVAAGRGYSERSFGDIIGLPVLQEAVDVQHVQIGLLCIQSLDVEFSKSIADLLFAVYELPYEILLIFLLVGF